MSTKLYFFILFRLMILFSFGFLFTFIWDADGIHDFLGDKFQKSRVDEFKELQLISDSKIREIKERILHKNHIEFCGYDSHYHWGKRHHWLFWFSFCVFILSFIDFIVSIRKAVLREYPNI